MAGFDAAVLEPVVGKALMCAIIREEGKYNDEIAGMFADAMGEIVGMGLQAVFVVLCGWCGLIFHGFEEAQKAEGALPVTGFWTLETVDTWTGKAASIDTVDDPAMVDTMRIVTCFGNKDFDTIHAIVAAAWEGSDEVLVGLLFAAVRLAAQMAMHLKETSDGHEG